MWNDIEECNFTNNISSFLLFFFLNTTSKIIKQDGKNNTTFRYLARSCNEFSSREHLTVYKPVIIVHQFIIGLKRSKVVA